ncbi:16922_t:CDS:2 [Funneliformis geosporum]|uniref:16922_t:CDS:1 n=1 Tax=Funneliformis geosporum TaxID=1117311 RepID=A0A9W4SXA5_9GLOM|nr:16922_t:CDS:2 [Funneliformis geosporum]
MTTNTPRKYGRNSNDIINLIPVTMFLPPSLSWDGMLKMSRVRIELFTDMTMHDFTEKAKRGRISMAC